MRQVRDEIEKERKITEYRRRMEDITHYKEHENRTLDDKNGGTERKT